MRRHRERGNPPLPVVFRSPLSTPHPRRGAPFVARRAMHPHGLSFTSLRPSSFGCCALCRGPFGDAGGSTKRPVERECCIPAGRGPNQRAEPAASGRKVASVAERNPPRARVLCSANNGFGRSPGDRNTTGSGGSPAPGGAASDSTAFGVYAWAGCRCFWASTSAIWIAFRAAPFRNWSPHTQKFRAFSALSSSRMRPT